MQTSKFDKLLERYLKGTVSEQERVKLEAWLDVMKAERNTNLELTQEEEDKLFEKITANINNLEEIKSFRPEALKQTWTQRNKWILQIAASIVFLVTLFAGVKYFSQHKSTPDQLTTNPEKLILNDGSLVWLRGASKFAYYEKGTEAQRIAELNGEALFEVSKDPSRPFIINCGDLTLTVLGTSFYLRSTPDTMELNVLTGKVNLSSLRHNIDINIEPLQKIVFHNGQISQRSTDQLEIQALTNNTEYDMKFANTSLEVIAERIGKKFNVQIAFGSTQIKTCRLTADLTDNGLDHTLQMIAEVLDVTYTKNGKTITINGTGCH
jgi:transmembrane sensor